MPKLHDETRKEMIAIIKDKCFDVLTLSEVIAAAQETVQYRCEDMNDQELYDRYEQLMELLGHEVEYALQ